MRRYYELAISVVFIGIFGLLLMRALDAARAEMEEAVMQSEAAAIRMALVEVLVHREIVGGALPSSANPLAWIAFRPGEYAGELDGVPGSVGVWYFDRRAGELVYRFRDGHRARFRFGGEGSSERGRAALAGVGLIRLEDLHD